MEKFDSLMVNNELSLYEEELNKHGRDLELNGEEASLEFEPIEEVVPQLDEQNYFKDDLLMEFSLEKELLGE